MDPILDSISQNSFNGSYEDHSQPMAEILLHLGNGRCVMDSPELYRVEDPAQMPELVRRVLPRVETDLPLHAVLNVYPGCKN